MNLPAVTVKLDRERAIRWTNRAQARNASLARPVSFATLARGRNQLYALCAIIWSALVEKDHGFDAPEDLADYLESADQQVAAFKAIAAMLEEAFPEKKTVPKSESSAVGPTPSSTSA